MNRVKVFTLVLLVSVGGCRQTSPSRLTFKIQPCSLITQAEAKAALGGEVEAEPKPESGACAYNLVRTGSANGSIVVILVTPDSPRFQRFGLAEDDRTQTKPISGVGDRAVLFMSRDHPDEGAKAIQAMKGNLYVAIGMSSPNPPVSEDVLKTLAVTALSRLP